MIRISLENQVRDFEKAENAIRKQQPKAVAWANKISGIWEGEKKKLQICKCLMYCVDFWKRRKKKEKQTEFAHNNSNWSTLCVFQKSKKKKKNSPMLENYAQ